jgi:hypothetical protein
MPYRKLSLFLIVMTCCESDADPLSHQSSMLAPPPTGFAAARHRDCEHVRSLVEAAFATELREHRLLSTSSTRRNETGDAEPCASFAQLAGAANKPTDERIEFGKFGDKDAAVFSDGPQGSGRYWNISVAIDANAPGGICFKTSTVGFRHFGAAKAFALVGPWRLLQGQLLHIWTDISIGSSNVDTALFTRVFRLNGSVLTFDATASKAELAQWASRYQALEAAGVGLLLAPQYAAISRGYNAFASDTKCIQ